MGVVVPVFNPGEQIDGLVDSLAAQSLPADQLEVIFVDDGSTDGTAGRLHEVCETHPNMRTVTIPNSGWPGRPRNIGTDLTTGEYVFYADQDDYLFPEALQRMVALATRNDSDIVFGKVVRVGRVGASPPRRNIDDADPIADALVASRTVHKLFRKAFLVEHGIRFLEGRVRLEDHHFMAQALPAATVVSVLADYPVYKWIHRNDGTNTSSSTGRSISQEQYWAFYAGAVRTFAEHAPAGEMVDAARLVAVQQAFARFSPARWARYSEPHRVAVFAGARAFVDSEFPARLDEQLPVLKRLRVQAIRVGDRRRFEALHRQRTGYRFDVRVERAAWVHGLLQLCVRATLSSEQTTAGGRPVAIMQPGTAQDTLLLPLAADVVGDIADHDRALLPTDVGGIELTVRHRDSGVEWPLLAHTRSTRSLAPEGSEDGLRLAARVEATLRLENAALGAALVDGDWALMARVQFLGETSLLALPAPNTKGPGTVQLGGRTASAYVTKSGKLVLRVTCTPALGNAGGIRLCATSWEGEALSLQLDGVAGTDASVVLRPSSGADALTFDVVDGRALVAVDALAAGTTGDLYVRIAAIPGVLDVRLDLGSATLQHRLPYVTYASPRGGLSLRHLLPGEDFSAYVRQSSNVARRYRPTHTRAVPARLSEPAQSKLRAVRRRLTR